jgi:solute:Na+ symporter, SSS family
MNWTTFVIFVVLFSFVTWLGFAAARWPKGNLDQLHEWGLGGRRFGTLIAWFLIGGDLYTAYTFIAVPALMFGAGAIGFFAIPYTVIIYPLLYLVFARLVEIFHKEGHVTAADFVREHHANRWLALAIAVTGVVASMPYIALQLVGLEVVLAAMGVPMTGLAGDLPLIVAFLVLAGFTYTSGLRAPAMIAIVKDVLIYVTALAAVVMVPVQLGGFGRIFAGVPPEKLLLAAPGPHTSGAFSAYASLALGSALALYLYPHALTGLLSASSAKIIRRNAVVLPAYSTVLGVLLLMGFMALAVGVSDMGEFADGFRRYGANFAVPALMLAIFPPWFAGVAFAAIAIGALVPASIMSIAVANIYTRDIYREFLNRNCTDVQETRVAKLASLIVKLGALAFILFLPLTYAVQLQLLGGVWIIQTLPAVLSALYRRFFNGWALLAGWAAGVTAATFMAAQLNFTSAIYPIVVGGFAFPCYIAIPSLLLNLAAAIVLSLAARLLLTAPPQTGAEPSVETPIPTHGGPGRLPAAFRRSPVASVTTICSSPAKSPPP